MSKTPYEIRLELLKMANEILVTPIFQTREAKLQEYHSKLTEEHTRFQLYQIFRLAQTLLPRPKN
jgi:hypothetical protein